MQTMKKTILYVMKRSVPILIGFFPIGVAYGVLMRSIGYNTLWSALCSVIVFSGSLQFLMVDFLKNSTPLLTVAVMAALLNSRHLFHGLSFIEKFRPYGVWRLFLAYSMSDEAYSLHCAYRPQEGVNEKWAYILSGAAVSICWLFCTMAGGLLGRLIRFDTTGIDFSLTALFVVILLDQLREENGKLPAVIAAVSSVACILLFGADQFILPSLLITVTLLALLRGKIEEQDGEERAII